MSGGQDWAAKLIESTGDTKILDERRKIAIEHCRERIEHYMQILQTLESKGMIQDAEAA